MTSPDRLQTARRSFELFTLLCVLFYGAATVWNVTVQGFWEPASLDVTHLEAGAGGNIMLARLILAFLTFGTLLVLQFFPRPLYQRLLFGLLALAVFPVFIWPFSSMQRWAPGYSEPAFSVLRHRWEARERLTTDEVIASVGSPLLTRQNPDGTVLWSYSYMPSGGFGWDKRFVVSRYQIVTEVGIYSEP